MTLRIALIANYLPAPANWGPALRVYHLARGLARIGQVTLFCWTSEEDAAQFARHPDLTPYAQVRMHTMPRKVYANLFKFFTEESMSAWMADDDPLAQLVQVDHQRDPFDVLVCEHLYSANVARALAPVPWLLDAHDIAWMAMSQMLAALPPASAEPYRAQVSRFRTYEDNAFRTATFVACVTQADAEYIRAQGQPAVRVIPNGVAVSQLPFTPPSQRTGLDILFVGSFFWPPNIKAARFLAKEVMPRVWQEGPSARLVLCGRSPGIEVALLQRRGIEVTGTVPSVQPYLDRAAVYANALFEGAGSSLKVMEALANGVPMISTAVGVRGFALVPGQHYVAAEDADSFAHAILAQFRNRAAADERAQAGRAFAEQFDWGPIGQEFAEVVARVARRE
jgi:glycosyltransferase involved in cell wall biosynthesis